MEGECLSDVPSFFVQADELNKLSAGSRAPMEPGERRNYLTTKLQTALETTAPLLREVMSDFRRAVQGLALHV